MPIAIPSQARGSVDILIVVVVIAVIIVAIAIGRGLQLKALARFGVPMQAVVEKKWCHDSKGRRTYRLRYQFSMGNGHTYQRSVIVTEKDYQRYQPGDSIDIVVLKEKPRNSALASMVALTQQALEKSDR